MPVFYPFVRRLRHALAAGLLLGTAAGAQAQDVFFSQPFATRLHTNPAFTGLVDDYSVTLGYRNQFPTVAGSFVSNQLAGDVRLNTPGQHHALGLLVNQDRTGSVGYTRLELGALYAYHTRLTKKLALSGGLRASYGRQRVGYDNFVFGDQIQEDGSITGPSAENVNFTPANYLSLGTGAVLYSEQGWLSLAGQHLNLPRYDRSRVDGIWMTRDQCEAAANRLLAVSARERAEQPCIGPDRADLVLAGAAILQAVQELWPCSRVRVADRGLREGILLSLMSERTGRRKRRCRRGPNPAQAAQ